MCSFILQKRIYQNEFWQVVFWNNTTNNAVWKAVQGQWIVISYKILEIARAHISSLEEFLYVRKYPYAPN